MDKRTSERRDAASEAPGAGPAAEPSGAGPPAAEPPPGSASTALEEQLCFALYSASRAVTAAYRPILDRLGLTYPQYLVMLVLWERGTVPVKDLGAALRLDYGTLSPLLKRLEAAGLVRRERRRDDERSVLVALTGQGTALRGDAVCLPGILAERIGLSEDEAGRLRVTLRELADRLQPGG